MLAMKMPRSVLGLAWAALGLAAFNLLGVFDGLSRYAFLSQLPLSVPLAYLIASHAVWAAAWAALAVGLWRRQTWARWGILIGSIVYVAQGWLNRWMGSRSDYVTATAPWALGLSVLGVGLAWWIILSNKEWLAGNTQKP